jgi:hypothetical protein
MCAEDALKHQKTRFRLTQNNYGKGHRMAMAHQAEFHSTLTRSENAAPEPTTLETSDIIILGNDLFSEPTLQERAQALELQSYAGPLIRNMLSDYIDVSHSFDTLNRDISDEDTVFTEYGSEVKNYATVEKYLSERRGEMVDYVNQAVKDRALELSGSAEQYLDEELARLVSVRHAAASKALEKTVLNPTDAETTKAFTEIVKDNFVLSGKTIKRIAKAAFNSGSIPVQVAQSELRDDKELDEDGPGVVRGYDRASV